MKKPLRRIVGVVEPGSHRDGIRDLVELECGHTVRSDATYRARCHRCAKTMTPTEPDESEG